MDEVRKDGHHGQLKGTTNKELAICVTSVAKTFKAHGIVSNIGKLTQG